MDFGHWSQELLAFKSRERMWPLLETLRGIATELGFRGAGRKMREAEALARIRKHGHPVLTHGVRLLGRVSVAEYAHVASLVTGSTDVRRPHPVAVMLCLKALLGPEADVLDALREANPQFLSPARRWLLLPKGRSELRVQFLIDHVRSRPIGDSCVTDFYARVAAELGVGSKLVSYYRERFPAFSDFLLSARPDLFGRCKPQRSLNELLAGARRHLPKIEAKSARELEAALAGLFGMTRSGLAYYRRLSPKLEKLLRELRPELYGAQGRLPYLLTRLKRFPHASSGSTRREYERNLAVFLDVGIAQVAVYKRLHPEFLEQLKKARQELYVSTSEQQLKRWLALLNKWGSRTKGGSIAEFENNLAARAGVGGRRISLARATHPEIRRRLLDLRPDLYESPRLNGRARFPVEEFLRYLRRDGARIPGKSIAEYETNLGALVGRGAKRISDLRAKNAEVAGILKEFRPDLYVEPKDIRGRKFPVDEFIKCVKRWGRTTSGQTVFEYETNLGALVGRGGRRVAELRIKNPEVAKLLMASRPDLYSDWRCVLRLARRRST
jgi:hypothetical protein